MLVSSFTSGLLAHRKLTFRKGQAPLRERLMDVRSGLDSKEDEPQFFTQVSPPLRILKNPGCVLPI